jgi:hypothetical protein
MFPKIMDFIYAAVGVLGVALGFVVAVMLILLMTKEVCAQGACYTNTYFQNGKMVVCQTCCNGNNCTTACF